MSDSGKRRNPLWWIGIATLLLLGVAVLFVGAAAGGGGRCGSPKNACINNLRQMDGAIEQWALEKKIPKGEPVVLSEVADYIKGGLPKCPNGGKYTIGKVDEPPRCSIPDHTLSVSSTAVSR